MARGWLCEVAGARSTEGALVSSTGNRPKRLRRQCNVVFLASIPFKRGTITSNILLRIQTVIAASEAVELSTDTRPDSSR